MTTIGQEIIKNEKTQQQITAVYEFIFQNDSQDGGEIVKMKNKEITKKKKKATEDSKRTEHDEIGIEVSFRQYGPGQPL